MIPIHIRTMPKITIDPLNEIEDMSGGMSESYKNIAEEGASIRRKELKKLLGYIESDDDESPADDENIDPRGGAEEGKTLPETLCPRALKQICEYLTTHYRLVLVPK